MRNYLLVAVALSLVVGSVSTMASHDVQEGDYFTAGAVGDHSARCAETTDAGGVGEPVPNEEIFSWEELFGWCLGGQLFIDLDQGRYRLEVEDEMALAGPSGAYRTHNADGEVIEDNVDDCFDEAIDTLEVIPQGGSMAIWIDGVVWWALGQPCGAGQSSQGTFGTVTISHI